MGLPPSLGPGATPQPRDRPGRAPAHSLVFDDSRVMNVYAGHAMAMVTEMTCNTTTFMHSVRVKHGVAQRNSPPQKDLTPPGSTTSEARHAFFLTRGEILEVVVGGRQLPVDAPAHRPSNATPITASVIETCT